MDLMSSAAYSRPMFARMIQTRRIEDLLFVLWELLR